MREKGVPFVRRRSGGGTVYHVSLRSFFAFFFTSQSCLFLLFYLDLLPLDSLFQDLGNTNYSFHTSRTAFERRIHSTLIVKALNSFLFKDQLEPSSLSDKHLESIPIDDPHPSGTYVNERNDICIKVRSPSSANPTFKELKISGSAYKLISKRAYHHGTMLLNASLSSLGKVLSNDRLTLTSKGVESFRSPVINLGDFFEKGKIDHQKFVEIVVREFESCYGEADVKEVDEGFLEEEGQEIEKLKQGHQELKSWEWNFGGSPEFFNILSSSRQKKLNDQDQETRISEEKLQVISKTENLVGTTSFPLSWGEFSLKVSSRNGLIEKIESASKSSLASSESFKSQELEQLDIDSDYETQLRRILTHFERKRYDDFGIRCFSGVDFERDLEEVRDEREKDERRFVDEVLEKEKKRDQDEQGAEIRERILLDLLKWFKTAF